MTTAIKTWGEAVDWTWNNHWKRQRSNQTVQFRVDRISKFCGLSFPLAKMKKLSWWIELQNDILEEDQVSNATVNRAISVASCAVRKTYEAQLHSVRCPKIPRLEESEGRIVYMTKEQVDRLAFLAIDIFDRQDLADAIIFSAYEGVRQGEFLKLKSEDIDQNLNVIWVGGKPGRITKSRNVRTVPIHKKVQPILERRLSNNYLFGDDWKNKDQLYRAFKKVRKVAGLSDEYVWHCLRHSYATWMGEIAHPRQIMDLMGHANIDTTLRYCKATDSAKKEAMDKL